MKTKNVTTLYLRKSIGRSAWRRGLPRVQPIWIIRGFLLIPLVLTCFGLLPMAQALKPPPDGGYAGHSTAEGTNALFSLSTGFNNTALGFEALYHNTTGGENTATGAGALVSNTAGGSNTANGAGALASNTAGGSNTALGFEALHQNTTGSYNTAVGYHALVSNVTFSGPVQGADNTATGAYALQNNTGGNNNTAEGFQALSSNTTGTYNTGVGVGALQSNIDGNENTAIGYQALFSNTTIGFPGAYNTATGAGALQNNTNGNDNTATGQGALQNNNTGTNNTGVGVSALGSNQTGTNNTAVGVSALGSNQTGTNNTAVGVSALGNIDGAFNIGLGFSAGQNLGFGFYNIDIGNGGVDGDDNTIRIGTEFSVDTGSGQNRTFIAGIRGVTTENADAIAVVIDSAGQLGTMSSSRRFKKEIKPMDQTSEAILGLKPVTFHYKSDSTGTPQFGLIAEEVAKINPDLVVRDTDGEIYTVRYDAVNAMLLNEFLKEHRKVGEQQATITELKKEMKGVVARLNEQASQIQKVSAQIEASKPVHQMVVNNQ